MSTLRNPAGVEQIIVDWWEDLFSISQITIDDYTLGMN